MKGRNSGKRGTRDFSLSAQRHEVTKFTQQQPVALEQEVENWQDLQEKQGTTVPGVISSFQKDSDFSREEKKYQIIGSLSLF